MVFPALVAIFAFQNCRDEKTGKSAADFPHYGSGLSVPNDLKKQQYFKPARGYKTFGPDLRMGWKKENTGSVH